MVTRFTITSFKMSRFQKSTDTILAMITKFDHRFRRQKNIMLRALPATESELKIRRNIPLGPWGVWFALVFFSVFLTNLPAEPLFSPTWGFRIDLPECYVFSGGDGRDRFSFRTDEGAMVDVVIYPGGTYASVQALAADVQKRLGSRGDTSAFIHRDRQAAVLELEFAFPGGGRTEPLSGWGICTELEGNGGGPPPLLIALAYGPADKANLKTLAVSALDSISPAPADERAPGPMMEFAFPREASRQVVLANTRITAAIDEGDAEAAQALADREFEVLRHCAETPKWKEAWIRFYRIIYRDAWDRLADAAFALERSWDTGNAGTDRDTAANALAWVQSFAYERDFMGSDFVNPVSAAIEGRGDCDSRALLWAIILGHADIPAAIMVSREYRHAMGLADIDGPGARFDMDNIKWLAAETTSRVSLGLIAADNADPSKWIGVTFYSSGIVR
jgi:hypothetical protein